MKKREFLKLFLLAGATRFLPPSTVYADLRRAYEDTANPQFLPILQGATTTTLASFSILAPKNLKLDFKIHQNGVALENIAIHIAKTEKEYSEWAAYKIKVDPLEPATDYQLVIGDNAEAVIDARTFSTLKPDQNGLKFAMASCMRDIHREKQKPMWAAMANAQVDCLFLLGDNVYVDQSDANIKEKVIWRRYVETRLTLDLYKWPRLVPTFATWDDHDYGKNNSHRDFNMKFQSGEVFRAMYAQDPLPGHCTWGPGVASAIEVNGQRFCMMDNRTFRTAPWEREESHWGDQQEVWLNDLLPQSSKPTWIFNGSQIFGGYRSGWAFEKRHPRNLKMVLLKLKTMPCPILWGSGDVHYSEVMKIEKDRLGYETYELTSSSMHSAARKPKSGNSRRIASTGEYNFLVVQAENIDSGLKLHVESLGEGSRSLFQLNSLMVTKALS